MTKISLLRCERYDQDILNNKIRESLENIGFDLDMLNGKRIAIKPNLLSASDPEKAVVTHPEFFRAVLNIVKEAGGMPVLIESPGQMSLGRVMKKTGYEALVAEEGFDVDPIDKTMIIRNDKARKFKRFEVIGGLADVDLIINLPKFKTHGITYITGAVKNLFGFIPGLSKSQWHLRASTKEEFAEFILDLYGAYLTGFDPEKPIVHIMDAIVGMDGEGPGAAGNPKRIGAVITGTDAVAVDFIAVNLVGLAVEKVLTITRGASRGLGVATFDQIELVGDRLEDFHITDFIPTRSTFRSDQMRWPFNTSLFKNLFVEKPIPLPRKCTLCYQCMQICPAGAIDKASGDAKVPRYDYNKCIRCYCCQEICPEAAIRVEKNFIQRFFR